MSSVIRWEPFRDLVALKDRMDRLFSDVPGRGWPREEGLTAGAWLPPVDVYETNDSIIMKAELPGLTENDVDISVEGNILTLKGERQREKEVEEKNYYRAERTFGAFTRTFNLPPTVDAGRIGASFSHGVLQLTLPKREETKPRQIKVKVESNGH